MRTSLLLALLSCSSAFAERGLMAFSLETGPSVTPQARALSLLGTAEYGLAERWAVALSLGGDGTPGTTELWIEAGPRLGLALGDWTAIWLFATPQASYVPSLDQPGIGARAGVGARYQLLWGLGLSAQLSVRWRLGAGWDAQAVAGLFIEA